MNVLLTLSRLALGMGVIAVFLALAAPRARRPAQARRKTVLAIATLALGLALFALFFGLIAGCDQL